MIVQSDEFNQSRINTVVCVPTTTNLRWAGSPGNVLLERGSANLPEDSVANVSLIQAIDRRLLDQRVGKLPEHELQQILSGVDVILGR